MTTITRRTALAVPVTLPLLPVSALAMPVNPVVTAFAADPIVSPNRSEKGALFLGVIIFRIPIAVGWLVG